MPNCCQFKKDEFIEWKKFTLIILSVNNNCIVYTFTVTTCFDNNKDIKINH